MKPAEYAARDALGLAELIRTRQVSASEVVNAAIATIEERNPTLNAVIHKSFERARREAKGDLPDGPFRGVPFLLKDLGCGNLAGDPIHWGTRFLRDADFRATTTSYIVEGFQRAGFVIVGRTNVPELGAWATTEPAAYGPSHNPWNEAHSTGGSSGGAGAAVAAGMTPCAHGSDGGGSIRNPASQCGLVGLKPTRGRVSLGPDIGEDWAGMTYEFALAKSVRDTAALLDCIHGPMPGDPYGIAPPQRPYSQEVGADPGVLRVGLLASLQDGEVHSDCVAAATNAAHQLEALGHHVEETFPEGLDDSPLMEDVLAVIPSCQARLVEHFGQLLGRKIGPDDMDCDNWAVTEMGQRVSATRYLAATEAYHRYQRHMAAWWSGGFDLLITPTLTAPPPRVGEIKPDPARPLTGFMQSGALLPFLVPFNITGQPAMSLPLHWNEAGLPIGVQLIAAFGREDLLLRVAAQLEQVVGWQSRLPIPR